MKTKLIKTIAIIFAAITLTFSSVNVFAECSSTVCDRDDYPASVKASCGCKDAESDKDNLTKVIGSIVSAVIAILGVVAIIFIVVGGIGYMTSTGDAGKVKKAKDTILYACIGLIICALAFAITQFVISTLNNATSTTENESSMKNIHSTTLII